MTDPGSTVISVRGGAELEVPPDLGTLACSINAVADDKRTALATASHALDAVRADLAGLGGVVRTSAAQRVPLAWLARSATSHDEFEFDKNGRHRTGRAVAAVRMTVEVRDFDLLDRLGSLLASHSAAHVNQVHWSVDADNPRWREVRSAAIEAALQQGRDYAAALGGSLQRIDQLADGGLLEHSAGTRGGEYAVRASGRSDDDEAPSLDPQPITLAAVIEARFTASVATL